MAVMVIAIVGIGFLIGYQILGPEEASTVPDTGGGIPSDGYNCPDDLATDFEGDCINSLNSSASDYLGCEIKLVPDNDFSQFKSYTCDTDSSRTSAVSLKCGHNYVAYAKAVQDSVNSFEPVSLGVVEGSGEEKVFTGTEFSALKSTAYDNLNKAFVYDDSDASNSDFDSLGNTYTSTTDNSTATAMGVGDIIDWSYTIKTTGSVGQFGDKDVGIYVAVDADKTDFEEPTIYFDGQVLTDIKGTGEMSTDDEATLSDYEYIFRIPGNMKVQPRTVRMVLQAKSGVDPDVDTKLRFCAKGYYIASDGYTIRKDCFNEASAAEIATATAQTITNDIS